MSLLIWMNHNLFKKKPLQGYRFAEVFNYVISNNSTNLPKKGSCDSAQDPFLCLNCFIR